MHVALALDMTKLRTHRRKPVFSPSLLLLLTLYLKLEKNYIALQKIYSLIYTN